MKSTNRIERLLQLIVELESGDSYTVDALAELTGVTRRTVFRDLQLLSRAGLRYKFDRINQRYSSTRTALLPPTSLSHAEALALVLAMRFFNQSGVPIDQGVVTSAYLKLESMLPVSLREYCAPLMRHIELRQEPSSDASTIRETLSLLESAMVQQRKVHVRYDSYAEREVIDVDLHAYRIAFIHRGWYLIAYTEQVDRVQTYKVERILRLKKLASTFLVDAKFNLDDYFGNAWLMIRGDQRYHVKIRFSPKVAANVDEIHWHKTQQTQFDEDGSLLFEVDVDGVDEISWWVLGYGDQAQVLEPPELQTMIAQRVANMHDHYNRRNRAKGVVA